MAGHLEIFSSYLLHHQLFIKCFAVLAVAQLVPGARKLLIASRCVAKLVVGARSASFRTNDVFKASSPDEVSNFLSRLPGNPPFARASENGYILTF